MDTAVSHPGFKRTQDEIAAAHGVNDEQTSQAPKISKVEHAASVTHANSDIKESQQADPTKPTDGSHDGGAAAASESCTMASTDGSRDFANPARVHTGFVNNNLAALHEYASHPERYCSTAAAADLPASFSPSSRPADLKGKVSDRAAVPQMGQLRLNSEKRSGAVEAAQADASPVIAYTDTLVLVRDKYPKAALHLLVLVRPVRPSTATSSAAIHSSAGSPLTMSADTSASVDLRATLGSCQSVSALRGTATCMQAIAKLREEARHLLAAVTSDGRLPLAAIPSSCKDKEGALDVDRLVLGFHAIPSLTPLHLHVLSPDLINGPCTKSKQHYNSFTTDFFIRIDTVLHRLEQAAGRTAVLGGGPPAWGGRSESYYLALLEARPVCHRCGLQAPNTRSFVKDLLAHARACKR